MTSAHDPAYLLDGDAFDESASADDVEIDPDELAAALKRRVLGQDDLVARISRHVAIAHGCEAPAPRGVHLLVGGSGVGKSLIAGAVSDALGRKRVQIECGQFNNPHYGWSIFGSPDGIQGDRDGILIREIRRDPETDVTFEEVEKAFESGGVNNADTTLQGSLLTLFKDGVLRHARTNEAVSFRRSTVFLTSNVAHDEFRREYERSGGQSQFRRAASQILINRGWRHEFVNRLSNIFYVPQPTGAVVREIAAMEIAAMVGTFAWRGKRLEVARGGVAREVVDEIIRQRELAGATGFHGLVEDLRYAVGLKLLELRKTHASVRILLRDGEYDVVGVERRS